MCCGHCSPCFSNMSSGKTHTRVNVVLAIGTLIFIRPLGTAFLVASGCLLGIFVGPDMDLRDNYSLYLIRRHLGKVPYWLWKSYWHVFCVLIPHRHFLSHFPVFSTIFRSIYFLFPLLVITLMIFPDFMTVSWFFPVFVGMVIVDTTHWVFDIFSSWFKKTLI